MSKRYEVVDLFESVAIELRPKSTAINPRYQIKNTYTGTIVDEFSTKAPAVADCRDLNREFEKDRRAKLAAIERAERAFDKAANILDDAHVALTSAFKPYELDEGLRLLAANASDEADRNVRQFGQRAEYMRARLND